jgi:hypothetical protein
LSEELEDTGGLTVGEGDGGVGFEHSLVFSGRSGAATV